MKRIAFITDLHLDEPDPLGHPVSPRANLDVILGDLGKRNISDVIFGGDLGEVAAHSYFFEKLKAYNLQVILGNHDRFEDLAARFEPHPTPTKRYYSTEDAFLRYLFLDSSADVIDIHQMEWLQQLIVTPKKLLIFIHHPVLPVSTPADEQFPLKNRDALTSLLISLPTSVTIFCGHYHMVDERAHKNITQFITPSSSFQLVKEASVLTVDNSFFGYRLITIDGSVMHTEVIHFKTAEKGAKPLPA